MASVTDRTLRRTAKVRRNVRRAAGGRARLSVFRSSKHIYAQVIDDLKGETVASASSLEKDMRTSLKTGANIAAAKAVGKLVAERAVRQGRQGSGVRSRRLSLSRPRQGARGCRARRRTEFLRMTDGHGPKRTKTSIGT